MELDFTDPDALAEENKPALIPVVAQLGQNYPNPFNLYTTIPFSIDVESYVSLNGRRSQSFVDPKVDLYRQKESFLHKTWILPFNDEINGL